MAATGIQALKDGKRGGALVGRKHSECNADGDCGIKTVVKGSGQPIEMEAGEVVITAPAVNDKDTHSFDGKKLTNRQILSKINEQGGGVKLSNSSPHMKDGGMLHPGSECHNGNYLLYFADGGHICPCQHSMKHGGTVGGLSQYEADVLRSLNAGKIRYKLTKNADSIRQLLSDGYVYLTQGDAADEIHLTKKGVEKVRSMPRGLLSLPKLKRGGELEDPRYSTMVQLTLPDGSIYEASYQSVEDQYQEILKNNTFDKTAQAKAKRYRDEYVRLLDEHFAAQSKTFEVFKGIDHHYKDAFTLNKAIEEMIDKHTGRYSAAEKVFLSYYSGYGGLQEQADERGVLDEYYTPDIVCKYMWALAYKYGFKQDWRVLEPAAGTGNLVRYAPDKSKVRAYELNKYSAFICNTLYPGIDMKIESFETNFIYNNKSVGNDLKRVDNNFGLVIGNPPYGDYNSVYGGMGERKYTGASNWISYFISRGLDMLVSGGLLVYLVGSEVRNGGVLFLDQKNYYNDHQKIAEKCTLLDAYRLPAKTFERTDVVTDIIVLRKN